MEDNSPCKIDKSQQLKYSNWTKNTSDDENDEVEVDNGNACSSGELDFVYNNAHVLQVYSRDQRISSDPVVIRCLSWRILILNESRNKNFLGYFVQCEGPGSCWSCHASAKLYILNQRYTPDNNQEHNMQSLEHTFHAKEDDWGFLKFISLKDLFDPKNGYYLDDSLKFRIQVHADPPHGAGWNSRKITGFVGIRNQGATCYMNSLLQALFFTNKLRKAVFENVSKCNHDDVPMRLAELFYRLQVSADAVDTRALTQSFGWQSSEAFMQHDAQELCRVLLEDLERKMRPSDIIPQLFCGKMLSYVRCKHVEYTSNKEESFYDIQLKVKDNEDIFESFEEYVAVETLDQDNLYNAGVHGMQEAEKGVVFLRFPPVLYLQLMRFQYDPISDANIKIHDLFRFPYILDLEKFLQTKDPQNSAKFFLHAVLVHCGDYHGGHYVVYINPLGNNCWFKFDDDVVSSCTRKEAIEANWGGANGNSMSRYSSAYMLVYMKCSTKSDLLCPVLEKHIPDCLRNSTQEAILTEINLVTSDHLKASWVYSLAVFHSEEVTVTKSESLQNLYDDILKHFKKSNVETGTAIRLWHIKDYHLELLTDTNWRNFNSFDDSFRNSQKFWLETVNSPNLNLTQDDMLFFVKFFHKDYNDAIFQQHVFLSRKQPLSTLATKLSQLIGVTGDICVYIEISNYHKLIHLSPNRDCSLETCLKSFDMNPNNHGQVLVVCPTSTSFSSTQSPASKELNLYTSTVPILMFSRSALLKSEQITCMGKHSQISSNCYISESTLSQFQSFLIFVEPAANYITLINQLAKKLFEVYKLEIAPDRLQLWIHKGGKDIPINSKIEYQITHLLTNNSNSNLMLTDLTTKSGCCPQRRCLLVRYQLYYTPLQNSITDLESMLTFDAIFVKNDLDEYELGFCLSPQATVLDLLDNVCEQLSLAASEKQWLRLWEYADHRLINQFTNMHQLLSDILSHLVSSSINSYTHFLRIDLTPTDQRSTNGDLMILRVAHYSYDISNGVITMHNVPFTVLVKPGDSLSTLTVRIQKQLKICQKEFNKWSLSLLCKEKFMKIEQDENLHTLILGLVTEGVVKLESIWLGLNHRPITLRSIERAIKIHN